MEWRGGVAGTMLCLSVVIGCSEPDSGTSRYLLPADPTEWVVGAHPLPSRLPGAGLTPTPPELVDRRLTTRDLLPPPASTQYESSIVPLPPEVLARSTWKPGCPVAPQDLSYLRMSFHGFDGRLHTGEMIVHRDVAADVVAVFGRLFDIGFPIEEMRVTAAYELDLPSTGDGNTTNAFVCRKAVGQNRFSAHASGLAIDVNPFQNPYRQGDVVIPELATAYLDRDHRRPGMIHSDDEVVEAFEDIGWRWGARWRTPVDIMHFSRTGD